MGKKAPTRPEKLNCSASPETDGYFFLFHNNGNVPAPFGPLQHFTHPIRMRNDIDVVDGIPSFGVILTRSCRVGSGIFSVYFYGGFAHFILLSGTWPGLAEEMPDHPFRDPPLFSRQPIL
mgnify:CR=1 FL=1